MIQLEVGLKPILITKYHHIHGKVKIGKLYKVEIN